VDDNYIVVNKPADVRVDGDFEFTVEKMVAREIKRCIGESKILTVDPYPRMRLVHQLDYATSGILLLGLQQKPTGIASQHFFS